MGDLLSVTYVLQLEDLSRQVQAHTIAAGVAQVMGGDVEIPRWSDVRARYDAALAGPPQEQDPEYDTEQAIMLRALGLSN